MIAALTLSLAVLAQPTQERPEDLSYMETYACVLLAQVGKAVLSDDVTQAVSEADRPLFDRFVRLEGLATAALEPAISREGDMLSPLNVEQGAARELLGKLSDDQMIGALHTCAGVFGVELGI